MTQAGGVGPARWVFTDRRGGASAAPYDSLNLADHVGDNPDAVASNRAAAAALLGVAQWAVVTAEHGSRTRRVSGPGKADGGDVLVTTERGLGLLVLAADCVPAVLVAPDVPAVAVVHSGWRGVVADAAGAGVAALVELGADPAGIVARLGPSVDAECYEVSAAVRDEVSAAAPPARAVTATGTPALDVRAGVVHQLRRRGVADIALDPRCTVCDPDLFSHRRDGVTGRQGGLVVLDG